MKWLDCILVYKEGKMLIHNYSDFERQDAIPAAFNLYCRYHCVPGHLPKFPVWFDTKKNVCIGMDASWLTIGSRQSCFISPKSRFLNGNRWDKKYVLDYYGKYFGNNIVANDEIVYLDIPQIEKFKDSKILIAGAGPSLMKINWDSIDYDYVFSCNHFFLHDKLSKIDIALVTCTQEVDKSPSATRFHEYMENNSTILCFDDRMDQGGQEEFQITKERYPDRAMYLHTRFRAKNGSCAKLMVIATLFGAKEIHVAGMDGFSVLDKQGQPAQYHMFQPGKKWSGTIDYHMAKQHYVILWDYLLNDIGKNVKYQNLGEGCESNLITDISRQMFPLERGV